MWPALLIAGLSALGGGLGNTKGARTGTQESITDMLDTTNVDLTDTPQLSPQLQNLLSMLTGNLSEYMQGSTEDEFLTSGIRAANEAGRIRGNRTENSLASRGLSYSPAGASAVAGADEQRIQDIIRAYTSAPIMAQQQQLAGIGAGTNLARSIPYGNRKTGTTSTRRQGTTSGTYTQPGSAVGSALGGSAGLLGMLYGLQPNIFGGGSTGQQGPATAIQALPMAGPIANQVYQGDFNPYIPPVQYGNSDDLEIGAGY